MTHLSTFIALNFSSILLGFYPLPARAAQAPEKPFIFHLLSEPTSLDPIHMTSPTGNYLTQNIYRSLYRYQDHKGLIPEGTQTCDLQALVVTCKLNPQFTWSNGVVITAQDYVRSWQRLFSKEAKTLHQDLLKSVKNAKKIISGQLSKESLAIEARDKFTLVIELEEDDPEFLYKLASPALAAIPAYDIPKIENATQLITSGPYKILEWTKQQRIRLVPNEHYPEAKSRPPVEVLMVDDDATALRLYESQRMNFLRRLVTTELKKRLKDPELHQIPMARFDYIGFSKDLYPKLRQALTLAADYKALSDIYFSKGIFGCSSLPRHLMSVVPCYHFNLEKAQKLWLQVPKNLRERTYTFIYSLQGGEDVSRQVEWFEAQWKKNLHARIVLKPFEQAAYVNELQAGRYEIFRKGVSADRPTCAGGIEIFSKSHPENYLKLELPMFDALLNKLKTPSQCTQAVEMLMKHHQMIPLGEMHFSILARPTFKGWNLNSLNQLDLTDLRAR